MAGRTIDCNQIARGLITRSARVDRQCSAGVPTRVECGCISDGQIAIDGHIVYVATRATGGRACCARHDGCVNQSIRLFEVNVNAYEVFLSHQIKIYARKEDTKNI